MLDKLKPTFNNRAATWIHLEPLNFSAVSSLVSRTLRRSKEHCQPLSRIVHAASLGNPFSVRNMLATLQRQHLITYSWEKNYWEYDTDAIEKSLAQKKSDLNPNDLSFLIAQLREVDEDARKYLVWASFFGST